MKSQERHKLKENEFAKTVDARARGAVDAATRHRLDRRGRRCAARNRRRVHVVAELDSVAKAPTFSRALSRSTKRPSFRQRRRRPAACRRFSSLAHT